MTKNILILIDYQNDYMENGKFPLWNSKERLYNTIELVKNVKDKDVQIIVIEHKTPKELAGQIGFLIERENGSETNSDLKNVLPKNTIYVEKTFASSFANTKLDEVLNKLGAENIYIGGWMTQNCLTHTVLDSSMKKYKNVKIIQDI